MAPLAGNDLGSYSFFCASDLAYVFPKRLNSPGLEPLTKKTAGIRTEAGHRLLATQPTLPHRSPISWRSVLLGLMGVTFICGLTPFNDYALSNTLLVGNNLPIGVVMLSFLFVLIVNAPLHRWWPRQALSGGELSVALSMTLVSCALPSSGLMRYLPPSLVSPFYQALSNRPFLDLLEQMHLPKWIFPGFSGDGPQQWMSDPIVVGYIGRWTDDTAYPLLAWVKPAVTWGIFLFALYGAMLCIVAIVRRQWYENERLAFPLAQIHLALIEQPAVGKALSHTLRARPFWIGFGIIFSLHAWNGLALYFPKHFPLIPVYYDVLRQIMSNPPWSYVSNDFKGAAVFFTAVGVTYFLSNSIAFSLWFFFIAMQVWRMLIGSATGDPDNFGYAGHVDQHFGGIAAFVISILWVGRKHWRLVLHQAFRGHKPGEPEGRYLSYRFAFWALISCLGVMILWLWVAGCTLAGATVMVLLLVMLMVVITRIIAESGLVHGQLEVPINYPWILASQYSFPLISPVKTFYFASMLQSVHFDFREVVPVYASHGLKIMDQTVYQNQDSDGDLPAARKLGQKIIMLLMLALLVGYVVSFTSTLVMEYRFAWTLDTPGHLPNDYGVQTVPQRLVDSTVQYSKSNYHPNHSAAGNFGFGFILVSALAALRLRFAWWPLHPIGFLMLYTYPTNKLWLSILIGWLAKNLILRFGGTKMYTAAKPFFIGLIVGESAAAGFWLAMGILMSAMNLPYKAVNIMPG
jgi:hypothetical protein